MKNLLYVTLLVFVFSNSYAQQDPILTQYMFNAVSINPGYAGSSEALSLDLVDRYQWVGMKNSPNTITFTATSNLPNPHLGVGLFTYRDALGPTVETGMLGSFAYKILFPKGKLSFGIQFGFDYINIDWNALTPDEPNDPALTNQVRNKAVLDAGAGIYYSTDQFYVGLSTTHLIENKVLTTVNPSDGKTTFSRLLRHLYAIGGVAIPLSDELLLRPSAQIKYTANSPLQADVDLNLLIHNIIWVGAGYRTLKCLTLMTEVNVTKGLRIGYSYDAWFNPLMAYNSGSHEIRLGYDLDAFGLGRMKNPRYF